MSKSKLSNLLKGRSVPNLPSYSSPWNKNDEKLWNAVKQQNIKQVKSVLSKLSITPTKLGPQGKSVFHLACEIGNDNIVDAILASAQDVNDTTIQGITALQRAAAKGHTSTVNKLLKKQANVDQRDCNGMTALHHACFGQHKDCVKALLLKNADINAVEQGGKTPLFYSAHLGYLDICRWLLERGADVNCQDKDNVTPLILAAKEGHKDVCELLLRHGANPNLADRYDKIALEYAVAAKHLELREVFEKSYKFNSHRSSVTLSETGFNQIIEQSVQKSDRSVPFMPPQEFSRPMDAVSINSMDDGLLPSHQFHTVHTRPRIGQNSKADETIPKYWKEAETVPKSVCLTETDETAAKSVYWKEAETVPKSVYLTETDETAPKSVYWKEAEETVPKAVSVKRTSLQDKFEEQEKILEGYQVNARKQIVVDGENPTFDGENPTFDNIKMKEIIEVKPKSDVTGLNQQVAALKKENEHLKSAMSVPISHTEMSLDNKYIQSQQEVKKLKLEKEQLEKQIFELMEQTEQQRAINLEEIIYQNNDLTKDVESLRLVVASLQEELKVIKNETPTDAQRLDAILAASENFEEVNFDEEGFVEGRDMTKEEFLQAQNQQLKTQCGCLTVELEKLRLTLDAILKAGDNLQSDYDNLAMEKDALQDELETTLKEKRDVITENEFLLADNNELHENLKKIVHELEKMQEKYQATHSENEELKRSVTVASKVGEVARLLEERAVLQQRCTDLESTSQRLQHDHDILLEEVQSLNDSLNQLTGERNQLAVDLEELESICQQHEALQVEYNQLEMEFAELLRDKEALEQKISNNNEEEGENDALKVSDTSSLEKTLKQLTAEKQELEKEKQELVKEKQELVKEKEELTSEKQELEKDKQELEDVVGGLSRHIVATEHVVKDLENDLEQLRAASVSQNLERNGMTDEESNKDEGLQKASEEVMNLKKQIARLALEVEDWEKKHADTVTTYRTHLLSAVQGHMDPDVKDALYHIIELRSMEQFC